MAKQKGDNLKVKRLQKLMLNSQCNILYTVHKITFLIHKRYKNLNHEFTIDPLVLIPKLAKIRFSQYLVPIVKQSKKPVYILNQSFVIDLCIQLMVLNILQPEWDAIFDSNTYIFRPERNKNVCIKQIDQLIYEQTDRKWILYLDMQLFFTKKTRHYLISKLHNFAAKSLIKKWFQAGYLNYCLFPKNEYPIRPDEIIRPLLVNIVLNGLETRFQSSIDLTENRKQTMSLIRYDHEFVILCSSAVEAYERQRQIYSWFMEHGLQFIPNKILKTTLESGFDFIGVNIHSTVRHSYLRICPSTRSIQIIRQKLKDEWQLMRGKSIQRVVKRLNPIISTWARQYCLFNSKNIFYALDNWLFKKAGNMCLACILINLKAGFMRNIMGILI